MTLVKQVKDSSYQEVTYSSIPIGTFFYVDGIGETDIISIFIKVDQSFAVAISSKYVKHIGVANYGFLPATPVVPIKEVTIRYTV